MKYKFFNYLYWLNSMLNPFKKSVVHEVELPVPEMGSKVLVRAMFGLALVAHGRDMVGRVSSVNEHNCTVKGDGFVLILDK